MENTNGQRLCDLENDVVAPGARCATPRALMTLTLLYFRLIDSYYTFHSFVLSFVPLLPILCSPPGRFCMTSNDLIITPARPDEAPRIATIMRAAFGPGKWYSRMYRGANFEQVDEIFAERMVKVYPFPSTRQPIRVFLGLNVGSAEHCGPRVRSRHCQETGQRRPHSVRALEQPATLAAEH